ncbi:MAG: XrtA-associated tyrosine autokinase [Piscinibacter sp.]
MSIIEQAVRRLEELRRSGVEIPGGATGSPAGDGVGVRPVPAGVSSVARPAMTVAAEPPVRPMAAETKTSKRVDIDMTRLAAMGYLTPETPRVQLADEFRVIKRPILSRIRGTEAQRVKRGQLLMVTSSVPGEGKTFTSINLAVSLAMEMDSTVLLVDADVSRPSVLSRLGLPMAPGLLDLLTDPTLGVSDVLLRTNFEKLVLLPSGKPHMRATELLASDAMAALVDELANRYPDRILVFDAPPLLPSPESRVLATHMGQVILVVAAAQTPQRTVEQALAAIDNCPVVLPLLNKISRSEVGTYYGYYSQGND